MRSLLFSAALFALLTPLVACGGGGATDMFPRAQCEDGEDNDGDGTTDFPDDLSCTSEGDDDESALAAPACKDGRDNDGDGKTDFPSDPGCYATHQDNEDDDCPDGPGCPQCSDGEDNDNNGQTDFPNDSGGCNAASDNDEYTRNLAACGSNVKIEPLPFDGNAMGMLDTMGVSSLISPMCGGAGIEAVYELRVTSPKVIVATTDNDGTAADTVLYIRGAECSNGASELACSNDISATNKKSTVTYSATKAGTYYLVVDAKDAATAGAYKVNVRYLTGEGETCAGADDCGPGLLCRVPAGQTTKVCAKPVCEDGLDDDSDGKIDYPNDPGCANKTDDTENDSCPGAGPSCPECGDGIDNDGDGKIDFGPSGDMTCKAAGDASEACVSSEGVTSITTAMVMGDTTNATNDSKPTCSSSTAMAPDLMYRLDLPGMATLSLNTTGFDTATALYDATCGGTAIACSDPALMTANNLAAGTYYFVVDGWSTGKGPFTIAVSGKIQNGQSCEGQLAQAGVITCNTGYACKGTMGSRTCQPSACLDGVDNDSDGKIDYPFDPGCADTGDNDEANPTVAPVCSNNSDDDSDGTSDFPADFGCAAASGTTEQFCMGETDPATLLTTSTATGTTVGAANDQVPSCSTSSTSPEKSHALHLPVPVTSLKLTTTGFDTVLSLKSLDCTSTVACNDEDPASSVVGPSAITTGALNAGGYAITVDGWLSNTGMYTLTVKGTVAPQTSCTSPLFSGGANAVLVCPTGTTCTGTPAKCQ
jgi:hypothetical protein